MADFPQFGKIGRNFFEEAIRPRLGAHRPEVVIGPGHGRDNAVVRLNGDQVMVTTTDPLTIIPALGIEDSAWLSVHLIASDLATSGLMPQYAVFELNLPPSITREEFERYWSSIHDECARLGIAIIAGHTGKFFGCDYTIVGGGMMIAVGSERRYVAPTMAQPGNHVIVTKGAAIGSTGILARVFPQTMKQRYGDEFQRRAAEYFRRYSVVHDAMTAVAVGVRQDGVTAMHDATEGGVLGGLQELASAAQCGIRVKKSAIPVSDETLMVCSLFEIDPYISLSEGTLLIAVLQDKVQDILAALRKANILAADVAELLPESKGLWLETVSGIQPLQPVEADPYWQAFADAAAKGWK
jgi:hydrogenase expression/formation protein HypE